MKKSFCQVEYAADRADVFVRRLGRLIDSNWRCAGLTDFYLRLKLNKIKNEGSIKTKQKKDYFIFLKLTFIYTLSQFINLISLLRCFICRKNLIIIYTNLHGYSNYCHDGRTSKLVDKINLNKSINIVEIARIPPNTKNLFFKLINLIFYKNPTFLTGYLFNLVEMYFKLRDSKKNIRKFVLAYLIYSKFEYKYFLIILKLIKPLSIFVWELSNRQAHIIKASNKLKIKTIGALHGAEMSSYMRHVHANYLNIKNPFIDTFFVWNQSWKKILEKSNIYKQVKITGNMVSLNSYKKKCSLKKTRPLKDYTLCIVIENLLPSKYIGICFNSLAPKNFKVSYKLRFKNEFYFKNYVKPYFSFLGKHKLLYGSINDLTTIPDFVIGTHSTAILDLAALGSIPIFLDSDYWGDYFDIKLNEEDLFYENIGYFFKVISNLSDENLSKLKEERLNLLKRLYPKSKSISDLANSLLKPDF